MAALESIKPNATIRGILTDSLVTAVSVNWFGNNAVELNFRCIEQIQIFPRS